MGLRGDAINRYCDKESQRRQRLFDNARNEFKRVFGPRSAEYTVEWENRHVLIEVDELFLRWEPPPLTGAGGVGWFKLGKRTLFGLKWSRPFADLEGLGRQLERFEQE